LENTNLNVDGLENNDLKPNKPTKFQKDMVVFIASAVSFMISFTTMSITVALPSIAREFAISGIFQNWIVTGYLLSVAVFSVPLSKVAGKIGLKNFFLFGIGLLALSSFVAIFISSAEYLLIIRIAQGFSSAILNVATLSMITKALEPHERGKGIGFNIFGVYIGLTLAPLIGGSLTLYLGWESTFWILVPFAVAFFLIALLKLPFQWKSDVREKFDYIGTITYGIGILLLIYGFTILNELRGAICLIIAIILLIIFVRWELKTSFPVFNVDLFKNVKFSTATLASLISYLATFVVTLILTYHLQYIMGFDSQTTGFILIGTPLMMAILAPFSGKLSDKIHPQILSAVGMAFVTIALFILIFINKATPLYLIVVAMIVQGIGYGLFSSPNTNAIMGAVPREQSSLASAVVSTVRVIGQTLSSGMLTLIFAIIIGSSQIVPKVFPQLIQSSQIALIISTVLCLIAIFISLVGIKSGEQGN